MFTKMIFMITSMGHEAETAVIPDDKPSTGICMDSDPKISKTWCWILPENGKEGEAIAWR